MRQTFSDVTTIHEMMAIKLIAANQTLDSGKSSLHKFSFLTALFIEVRRCSCCRIRSAQVIGLQVTLPTGDIIT